MLCTMRIIITLICLSTILKSQNDSAIAIPLVGIHFSGQLPSGDLVKRFGGNLNTGGSFVIKTKKNWLWGFETNYLFGKNVKEDVTTQLKNTEGLITDNEGYPADLRISERGLGAHLFVGKIIKVGNVNRNSGLVANIGIGYLQHKINLYDAQQKIAALKGERRYGYDRLSAGLSLTQFVGYMYLSENHLLNFYIGIETYQAFTKSLRKMNYDTGLPDTKRRLDILGGIRIGWILPLYKKTPNEFYYN